MDKNLLIATLTGQLLSACINNIGLDNITEDTIRKCKDLSTQVLSDVSL